MNDLDKKIEELLKIPLLGKDIQELADGIKKLVESEIKKAEVRGRNITLDVLEAHIRQQIFEPTVNTNSLLKYIQDNRDSLQESEGKG